MLFDGSDSENPTDFEESERASVHVGVHNNNKLYVLEPTLSHNKNTGLSPIGQLFAINS